MMNRDQNAMVILFFLGWVMGFIITFTLTLSTHTVLEGFHWEYTQAVIEDSAPECVKYEKKGE